jgi:hypothetical protein
MFKNKHVLKKFNIDSYVIKVLYSYTLIVSEIYHIYIVSNSSQSNSYPISKRVNEVLKFCSTHVSNFHRS